MQSLPLIPNLPTIIPAKPRVYKKRPVYTPPVALNLIAATYDPDGPEVYLTFDRAINLASVEVSAFVIADPGNGYYWSGFETPHAIDTAEVQIVLTRGAAYGGSETLLTAGAGNGIVAVGDGGTWAGVSGLALPFP